MAYERFRVLRAFDWQGWAYAPDGQGSCDCQGYLCGLGSQCKGEAGSGCECKNRACRCTCGIARERYAGNIWVVEDGHPRKAGMLTGRFACGDSAMPSIEDLLQDETYSRLVEPFDAARERQEPRRELVGARGPGRPRRNRIGG